MNKLEISLIIFKAKCAEIYSLCESMGNEASVVKSNLISLEERISSKDTTKGFHTQRVTLQENTNNLFSRNRDNDLALVLFYRLGDIDSQAYALESLIYLS